MQFCLDAAISRRLAESKIRGVFHPALAHICLILAASLILSSVTPFSDRYSIKNNLSQRL